MGNETNKNPLDATLSDFGQLLKERLDEKTPSLLPGVPESEKESSERKRSLMETAARLRAEEERLRQESQLREQQEREAALKQKQTLRRNEILAEYKKQEPAIVDSCAKKARQKRNGQVFIFMTVLGACTVSLAVWKTNNAHQTAMQTLDQQSLDWKKSHTTEQTTHEQTDNQAESALREKIKTLQNNVKKNPSL